ncbi:MAG: SET domain-containing protein-lysine N-methyltransferase [Nanoarchaeota archaeon]
MGETSSKVKKMGDLHNQWKHRWITPKAKSSKSKIEGLGVIAIENISKGEIVGILGGIIIPISDISDYWKKMGHVGIQIDDSFWIAPTSRKELEETGVFNHSCEPNCGFSNQITLIAIKDINKGEELTFDYAFSESKMDEFKCNCGSENCRKIIKQTDWKNLVIQKRYLKYFSPYLKNKIRN